MVAETAAAAVESFVVGGTDAAVVDAGVPALACVDAAAGLAMLLSCTAPPGLVVAPCMFVTVEEAPIDAPEPDGAPPAAVPAVTDAPAPAFNVVEATEGFAMLDMLLSWAGAPDPGAVAAL